MAEMLSYLNGRLVPASECRLAVFDLGIVLGAAVTDLARTFNGKPFRLEDHVHRLYRSARYARIQPPASAAESMTAATALIENNCAAAPGRELAIVFYLTAGENPVYAGAAGIRSPLASTYVMHTFPLPFELWAAAFREGYHCVTPAPRTAESQKQAEPVRRRVPSG